MLTLSLAHFAALTIAAGPLLGQGPTVDSTSHVTSAGSTAAGIPFGLWGMAGRELIDPYTSAMQQARPESVLQDLAAAKAKGAHVVVNFAGGGDRYTDSGRRFDFNLWKTRLDRFRPMASQLNAYVADGTLLAVMILDEPYAKNRWGGETVPTATLDDMAGYAKALFPNLSTVVRAAPSDLQRYHWRYLDAAWAQYTAKKGPIADYVSNEVAGAKADGLGLIVGLNITHGGDGSSGVGGDKPAMSGAEILRYGHALLDSPYACAFISWDSRARVLGRPDVAAALKELADAARAHPATSCRQGGARRTS